MNILLTFWNHRAHRGCGMEMGGNLCPTPSKQRYGRRAENKNPHLGAGWELRSSASRSLRLAYTETVRKVELAEERDLKKMH